MPSSSRSTHYQRFIPSEEVQVVATWEFKPVDGSQAQPVAPEPPEPELTPERLEELRQQAYEQGLEQGRLTGAQETRAALEQQLQARSQEQAERVAQLMQQAQQHFDHLEQALAAELLELACDLARQVVRRELSTPLQPLQAVVREALAAAIDAGRPATLRVHPDDAALLEPAWGAAHAPAQTPLQVRIEPDAHLSRGSCVVESAHGAVDGRVEKRWARAVANLGLAAPWQPGEDADV